MTRPDERTRALVGAYALLDKMSQLSVVDGEISAALQQEAVGVLRHFPTPRQTDHLAVVCPAFFGRVK